MENASKALIISGAVLLALLTISVLVMGWNKVSKYGKKEEKVMTQEQLAEFNEEFISYSKNIVRGVELISLNNLIEDTNERYSGTGYKEITGYIRMPNFTPNNTILHETIAGSSVDGGRFKLLVNGVEHPFGEYFGPNGIYTFCVDSSDNNFLKIFKEAYFKCTGIDYDGDDSTDPGTGRVKGLHFVEIKKKE